MMKRLFSFLILLALSTLSYAQPIRIGGEIGVSYVSLPYEEALDEWDPSGRPALSIMVFTMIPLGQDFVLQPGLRFSTYGNDVDFVSPPTEGASPVSGTFRITQRYLSLPLRVRYSIQGGPLYLVAGPEAGYLVSAELFQDVQGVEQDESITDTVARFNLILSGGIGSAISVGGQQLYIQALYGRGITGGADSDQWASDWTTQEIVLSVGYVF